MRPRAAQGLGKLARLEQSRQRAVLVKVAGAGAGEGDLPRGGDAAEGQRDEAILLEQPHRYPRIRRRSAVAKAYPRAERAQGYGLDPERTEIPGDGAHRPACALAEIVVDRPIVLQIGGVDDPAGERIDRPGEVDRDDDDVGEIGIDLQKREEPPFQIAQVAFETGKEIADPRFESG